MALFWDKVVQPMLFRLDAERAHELAIKSLRRGLAWPWYGDDHDLGFGAIERFGLKFPNPIGVAAGFDKNGIVVDELASLGFGFVEVGTVTYEPQSGNPKPRLFRLTQDEALLNRLGFNNDGAVAVAERLSKVRRRCVVGVNIGRNRNVSNDRAVDNYMNCFETVLPVADYVVVNVSSPNTPELRNLQQRDSLDALLSTLQTRNTGKPLLVKIAPDLTQDELVAVVDTCLKNAVAGIVATNTTVSRDSLVTDTTELGAGGLSGKPLTARSNEVISAVYRLTNGKLPIIGVGGVFSAQDAFDKLAAGACLIQTYTGFVYRGPAFPRSLNHGLQEIVKKAGVGSLDEVVGSAHLQGFSTRSKSSEL